MTALPATFWRRVDKTGECWLWTGYIRPDGYAMFNGQPVGFSPRRSHYAHRLAYISAHGEPPEGYQVDHLCRVRHCVNPSHLEAVTPQQNMHRGQSPTIVSHLTGRCLRGHAMTPDATYVRPNGGRTCRICRRDRDRILRDARRAAAS